MSPKLSSPHLPRWRVRAIALATGTLTVAAALTTLAGPASAAKAPATIPGGNAWAVSLGDSYISGEAGRWAGNSDDSSQTDALGSTAYDDAGSSEAIPGCHRSKSSEIGFGTISGANLACSGAETATAPYSSGSDFKPGLDFYNDGAGHLGQALALQNFAATHRVSLVAVSIGGNDFNFGSIVQSCVEDFLTSPTWWKNYCNDDSSVTANFTSANITAVTAKIAGALRNVNTALANDGYTTADYSILLQTYPSPLPAGSGIRYSESGFTRQSTGGCGFWNNDANWANSSALPTINASVRNAASQSGLPNVKIMDVSALFNGRRLCETGVQLLSDTSLASWRSAGAVDQSEWIEQIRTVSTVFGPYYVQESLHPNYWGQLALRSCLRQAYNSGAVRSGTCNRSANGLDSLGEPNVSLN
ncbi:MAG: hypothetical protein M3Y77_14635 [Actinomycetota bacterium]|nr:hypothetical protein [Actinomycetota bacterium]MDQ2847547.1 hypothetical protein [Actinomycetota bacterium]MDQ2956637.1 hypothetical protein [Actinomycetota bacterium]